MRRRRKRRTRHRLHARGRILSDQQLEEVRETLVVKVMRTFELRPMRDGKYTERELQDRLDLAIAIWDHCYGECRWSRDRTLDHMLSFMVQCIDGARVADLDMKPETREGSSMYAPEKLNDIEAERRLSALAVGGNNGRERT